MFFGSNNVLIFPLLAIFLQANPVLAEHQTPCCDLSPACGSYKQPHKGWNTTTEPEIPQLLIAVHGYFLLLSPLDGESFNHITSQYNTGLWLKSGKTLKSWRGKNTFAKQCACPRQRGRKAVMKKESFHRMWGRTRAAYSCFLSDTEGGRWRA